MEASKAHLVVIVENAIVHRVVDIHGDSLGDCADPLALNEHVGIIDVNVVRHQASVVGYYRSRLDALQPVRRARRLMPAAPGSSTMGG